MVRRLHFSSILRLVSLLLIFTRETSGFAPSLSTIRPITSLHSNGKNVDIDYLKTELGAYLRKREELNADEAAKQEVGRVIGGTKGNKILEYVSGAPNKPRVIETTPNMFDYDELEKYGFSYLATPIMEAGGRFAMYRLLGLDEPAITSKPKPTDGPELKIDRTGETDPNSYKGLGFRNMDDEAQAQALERLRKGQTKKDLNIPEFEKPFAYVKGTTLPGEQEEALERIVALQEEQSRAARWARKARMETLMKDDYENLNLNLVQRVNSVSTILLVALSFGRSTPSLLATTMSADQSKSILETLSLLQGPALALAVASLVSGILCAVSAPEKRRNGFFWFMKGLLGGPLTLRELKDLPRLVTFAEKLEIDKASSGNM